MELKIAVRSFQAKDMVKLLMFQRRVESFLEGLTDETQVNILWDFSNKINHPSSLSTLVDLSISLRCRCSENMKISLQRSWKH